MVRHSFWSAPWVDFKTVLAPQKGPKTEPKTTQNRSKNHLKKRSPLGSLLRPSWDDLGPILAASWALLGVKIVLWPTRRSFFQKSTFSKRSGVKTRLGTILGRFGSPKGVVLGGQKGPKRHQKRDQNDIKILIDFWIDFGPIWDRFGTSSWGHFRDFGRPSWASKCNLWRNLFF